MQIELLLKPVLTEKALKLAQAGVYTFLVHPRANKTEVKKLIKQLYNADVSKINVMHTPAKFKQSRRSQPATKRHEHRKMLITIKGKKTIDIFKVKAKV